MFKPARLLALASLLAMLSAVPVAQTLPPLVKAAPKWIFQTVTPQADGKVGLGTAFCEPGQSHSLITAGHVIEEGPLVVADVEGNLHVPKISAKSQHADVGRIVLEDDDHVCEGSQFMWAKRDPEVGEAVWMLGHPAGIEVVVTTQGIVSSNPTDVFGSSQVQLTQLHGLPGSSGSPVLDQAGRVVGIMVSGTGNGTLNAFVPVSQLRKF